MKPLRIPGFYRILLVVLFALTGYAVTSAILTHNTIQYTTFEKNLTVSVHDGSGRYDQTNFVFPVSAHYPSDSIVRFHSAANAGKLKNPHYPESYWEREALLFHQNPTFLVWILLISVMVAIAAGSFPLFTALIIELRQLFGLSREQVIFGVVYALLIGIALFFTNLSLPGYYRPEKMLDDLHILLRDGDLLKRIVLITVLLVLPAMALVFMVGVASDNIVPEHPDEKNIEFALRKLRRLNDYLQKALQLLAIIVVFSVLTSSALGVSIKSTVDIAGYDVYPKEISYVYGLYFTIFLCLIYIPVYYYLRHRYNQLREQAMVIDVDASHPEQDVYKHLFGDIKGESSALNNIKLALTLLAPFISSFIPQGLDLIG